MPNYSYYGVPAFVGSDVASTAIEDTTNFKLLDAAAGHVWQVATATAAEGLWLTANAVSPTATTATYKAAMPAAGVLLTPQGLQVFVVVTGTAGGSISWGSPVFVVSFTGGASAIVSATNAFISGPVTATQLISTGVVSASGEYITGTVTATVAVAVGTNPAQSGGAVRLPYAGGGVYFRNAANASDYQAMDLVTISATNVLAVGTSSVLQGVALGTGSVTTTSSIGFVYMNTCVGTPTGVPVQVAGFSPMLVDDTNQKLWVWSNSLNVWKGTKLS